MAAAAAVLEVFFAALEPSVVFAGAFDAVEAGALPAVEAGLGAITMDKWRVEGCTRRLGVEIMASGGGRTVPYI